MNITRDLSRDLCIRFVQRLIYLTENFTDTELACPCCKKTEMNTFFLTALQEVRYIVGHPFIINSGFRCVNHNKTVGGSKNSKHIIGMAADISIQKWKGETIHKLLQAITMLDHSYGYSGLGVYPSWVHFDLRYDSDVAWVGSLSAYEKKIVSRD